MKIGKLAHTNSKGQLVIPQEYRELLGINSEVTLNIILQKTGLFIQPIEKVIPEIAGESMYAKTLEKTAGAWRKDLLDANNIDSKTEKKKREFELEASKTRKKPW